MFKPPTTHVCVCAYVRVIVRVWCVRVCVYERLYLFEWMDVCENSCMRIFVYVSAFISLSVYVSVYA